MQIVGIDEVGRGALAGPVVAGAVLLKRKISGLKDSKLLTRAEREELAKAIYKSGAAVGLGWTYQADIDKFGLTQAVRMAMKQALEAIKQEYEQIIIDGSYNFLADNKLTITQIKADQSVPAVSAASIVAKVARDQYMIEMAKKHPYYFFERNVGYGTHHHLSALENHGLCDLHRVSFKPIRQLCLL